ncbi:hypothetical protein PYCCODRAFT_1103679 [Trametes coccinea BRFM310]|uniref:Uncharacterized protein n=1 Tax=Trametes coccinea (strain BRFM310) TaxID=1353009 RepID=A0A1Y2I9E7_TRAC3|nr:hypothetical protein PYCCODRAFT_1103679 [Trametes coccinea BRFM310]
MQMGKEHSQKKLLLQKERDDERKTKRAHASVLLFRREPRSLSSPRRPFVPFSVVPLVLALPRSLAARDLDTLLRIASVAREPLHCGSAVIPWTHASYRPPTLRGPFDVCVLECPLRCATPSRRPWPSPFLPRMLPVPRCNSMLPHLCALLDVQPSITHPPTGRTHSSMRHSVFTHRTLHPHPHPHSHTAVARFPSHSFAVHTFLCRAPV